jgi:hypothetical protein
MKPAAGAIVRVLRILMTAFGAFEHLITHRHDSPESPPLAKSIAHSGVAHQEEQYDCEKQDIDYPAGQ